MPVSANQALFSLLGTIYGGDGRATFGLPDLRGRLPMHRNNNADPGGVPANIGQRAGLERVTLTATQIPAHSHTWQATTGPASTEDPASQVLAGAMNYANDTSQAVQPLYDGSVGNSGAGQPHDNMMPYPPLAFIIALQGIYPSRN